jgi:hypothetical protein
MSRNIDEKLASGETLSDDDVAYASDHNIALPEEYGAAVKEHQAGVGEDGGRPIEPVFQTGPAFASPQEAMGPGVFLSEEELDGLNVGQLRAIAEVKGVEVSGRKASIVATLASGAEAATDEEDEEDEG